MFTSILVPLDGSPNAEVVIPYAAMFAEAYGAGITLAAVVHSGALQVPQQHQSYVDQVAAQATSLASQYLHSKAAPLRERGITVSEEVLLGDPGESLVAYAEKSGMDLIAISSHGRSGLGRWMFGSVADKILHLTRIPMLVIRPQENAAAGVRLRSLIVPLDGSPLTEKILPYAQDLARRLKLSVILAQAVQVGTAWHGAQEMQPAPDTLVNDLHAEATRYLDYMAQGIIREGIPCQTRILPGTPADAISDFARTEPDSLVAMCTHARSGVGRALLGSVADRVIRTSGDAVFVLRPE